MSLFNSYANADQPIISFRFFHKPILTAKPGEPLNVSATIDPADKVAYASLLYKSPSDKFFKAVFLKRVSGDTFSGIIPAQDVNPPKLLYYITVVDTDGGSHLLFMGPKNPQIVDIGEVSVKSAEETSALEQELALFSSEDIVYSAAKHKQKITQAPAAISVITANDIKYGVGLSLSDILRTVPGMDVAYINPAYPIFNERGYGTEKNNRMLVLLNGRVLNNTLFGPTFIEDIPVPLNEIGRIEIIRGASSSLYGADAVTGIISITTKKPEQTPTFIISGIGGLTSEKPAVFFGNYDGSVIAQGETGSTGFISSVGYKHLADFSDPSKTALNLPKAWLYVDHNFSDNLKASLEGGWDKPNFELFTDLNIFNATFEENYLKADVEYKGFKADAYWNRFYETIPMTVSFLGASLNLFSSDFSGVTNSYNLDLQYNLPEIPYNKLIVGLNINYNAYNYPLLLQTYNGIDLTKEFIYGGFIHDEIGPFYNFVLTLDARYDHFSVTKPGTSYRANLSYSITPEQTVRVSYGTAFRKPIYMEAQFIPAINPLPGIVAQPLLGNPYLKNEQIRSTEFGYIGQWGTHVRTELTAFYQELLDMINFTLLYNPMRIEFMNSSPRYVAHGGEAGVEYEPIQQVKTFANYSFILRQDTLGSSVDNYSTEKFNIGARYALTDTFFINVDGDYVSAKVVQLANPAAVFATQTMTLPPYFIVNTKVGYTLVKNRFEIGAYVFNLFNDIHHEFPYFNLPNPALTQTTTFGGEEIGRMLLVYANLYF
ncbi:MAG: TonB-dependent receptor plug domain-containing protein [bacterium]